MDIIANICNIMAATETATTNEPVEGIRKRKSDNSFVITLNKAYQTNIFPEDIEVLCTKQKNANVMSRPLIKIHMSTPSQQRLREFVVKECGISISGLKDWREVAEEAIRIRG